MLYYALIFFIASLIAAVFGFTGIAGGTAAVAKILFFVFLLFAAVALAAGLLRKDA